MRLGSFIPYMLLTLLVGCVSVQQYPQEWATPSPARGGECPAISGSYSNKGEGKYPQHPPNLAYQLLGHRTKWLETDRVDIELSDPKKLLIRTIASGRSLGEFAISIEKDGLSCEGGYFVLHKREFINRDGAIGSRTSELHISASDGNLVIKEETTEIGMLFLIPGGSSSTTWSRYLPLNHSAQPGG